MVRPNPRPGKRVFLGVVGLTLAAALVLAGVSQLVEPAVNHRLFAETGPFEQISPWLWILLALLIPAAHPKPTPGVAAGVIVSLAAAAREWDMHSAFTGYSVLKPGFYTTTEHPLPQQLLAGVIVLAVLAGGFYLLYRFVALRPWMKSPRPAWLFALLFAAFMLAATKVLDRTPGILSGDFGYTLPERALLLFTALEEGLEMLLPVFFAGVVLAHAALIRQAHHRFEPEHASER